MNKRVFSLVIMFLSVFCFFPSTIMASPMSDESIEMYDWSDISTEQDVFFTGDYMSTCFSTEYYDSETASMQNAEVCLSTSYFNEKEDAFAGAVSFTPEQSGFVYEGYFTGTLHVDNIAFSSDKKVYLTGSSYMHCTNCVDDKYLDMILNIKLYLDYVSGHAIYDLDGPASYIEGKGQYSETDITDISRRITDVETENTAQGNQLASLQTWKSDIQEIVNDIEDSISSLEGWRSDMESSVTGLVTEINALKQWLFFWQHDDICDSIQSECEEDTPPCIDGCFPVGERECSGDGYITCGDYDDDTCLEWSTVVPCPPGKECVNGECVIEDECNAGDKGCTNPSTRWNCEIQGDGYYDIIEYDCPTDTKCSDGLCLPVDCTSDSDCPKDTYTGRYCVGNAVNNNYRDYYCDKPDTVEASCQYTETVEEVETCDFECVDGACVGHPPDEVIFRTNGQSKNYPLYSSSWLAMDVDDDGDLEGYEKKYSTSISFCPSCKLTDPYGNCVVVWNRDPCVVTSRFGYGCTCQRFDSYGGAETSTSPTEPYASNGQEVYG